MDVSDIIDLARDQTHTDNSEFTDARVLKYLNIVKNNFWSSIVTSLNEDYGWDIFLADTVVDQDEYSLPPVLSETAGNKKLRSVSINYDGETYDNGALKYVKATETKLESLSRNWEYYKNNQDPDFPIYYIADKSIFIAPMPTSAGGGVVSNGLQLKAIKTIPNYETTTLEENMVIPIDYHDILIQGILPYIYKAQGLNSESNNEKGEYIRQRDQAIRELADRNTSPLYLDYPEDRENRSEIITINLL